MLIKILVWTLHDVKNAASRFCGVPVNGPSVLSINFVNWRCYFGNLQVQTKNAIQSEEGPEMMEKVLCKNLGEKLAANFFLRCPNSGQPSEAIIRSRLINILASAKIWARWSYGEHGNHKLHRWGLPCSEYREPRSTIRVSPNRFMPFIN